MTEPASTTKLLKPLFTRNFIRQWTPVIVLFIMLIIVGIWNPAFFQSGNSITVFKLTSILLLAAIGQTWVIMLGSIDLSVGAMASLSSVVFAITVSDLGFSSLLLVILIGLVGGLLNGLIFTTLRIPSFIATLGIGGIFLSLAYVISNGSTVAVSDPTSPVLNIFSYTILQIPVTILIVFLVWLICYIYQRYTIGGRKLYYIGSSEATAWMSGVLVQRNKIMAFMVSGITGSLAGVLLVGEIFNGSATLGDPYLLKSIAVVVIGGTALTGGNGGIGKTLIGAFILAILSNGMNVVGVNSYFQDIVMGAVIILASMISLDRSKIPMLK